jgi:hypothetical protein
MVNRVLAALALLALPLSPVMPLPVTTALAQSEPFPVPEMMRATGLDEIFTQFGPAIAASARAQNITDNQIFIDHWEATAKAVFDAGVMRRQLAGALAGQFSPDDQQALGMFFHSDFGQRITGLERAVALLDPAAQEQAIADGSTIATDAGPVRTGQLDRMMQLVSAQMTSSLAGESMRAMLVGMAVSHQQGDIEVPWSDIDAQVNAMMPTLVQQISQSQRALMAYAYRDLTDAELDRYIAFLATTPAQHFYGVAAKAVGKIVTQSMSNFGAAFAAKMRSVNV